MTNLTKKLMGHVAVDSGLLMLCDPCYVGNSITPKRIAEAEDDDCLNYFSIPFELGHEGAGIVFSNPIGDGFYEVWGWFAPNSNIPQRIMIDFTEDEELS